MLLTVPGLAWNPYQFVNIGHQYYKKGTSSTIIKQHARPIDDRIGYDGQFYYFLAVDPTHGRDYMDAPGIIYSRIGYPMTARALSGGNPTLIPYMMVLVNILAAVGGTLVGTLVGGGGVVQPGTISMPLMNGLSAPAWVKAIAICPLPLASTGKLRMMAFLKPPAAET